MSEKRKRVDWNALLSELEDVDEMCEVFTSTFLQIARECIPTKQVTIRSNDKTWFNSQIRKEIRIRDRLRKKVNKFGRESDILKYKKQRNKVNNMKKVAKENFEKTSTILFFKIFLIRRHIGK